MRGLILLCGFLLSFSAQAAVNVVTTSTDLAWAAQQIGKDKVKVQPLLKGTENMHFVEAVPAYIKAVADADVVCQVGLSLEIGWLPKVLAKSGNAAVQKGGKGFCDVGQKIKALDKPAGAVDRSMGDVHPEGNPHYWLSPVVFGQGATEIADVLSRVDPKNAPFYAKNLQDLQKQLQDLQARLKKELQPLQGKNLMQYHTDFNYFLDAYGLKSVGSIEEKPGVPPSAGRLARVSMQAKDDKVVAALAVDYDAKGTLDKFRELSGIPVARVANASRPAGTPKDYVQMQEAIVKQLLDATKR